MGYKVAIAGATGNVGRELLNILDERSFPVDDIVALASSSSVGTEVYFGDKAIKVQDMAKFDFKGIDIVLSSPGAKVSAQYSPIAAKAGAVVIDNTSHFRMDPDVPLIVPEVNPEAIKGYSKRNIIANPNCSTIQMVVALKPIHEAAGIKRIVVCTYQSVSGSGKAAMDELFNQTKGIYMNQVPVPNIYPKQIAFNAIPQIDAFLGNGMTKEEMKMVEETKKILDAKIEVCASCVRVPVFISHAEMINVEMERELSPDEIKKIWREFEGVTVIDLENEELSYVTPREVQGDDAVYVSRIRKDPTVKYGLNFWCVADNLRKGAALNAVQIAELLIKEI